MREVIDFIARYHRMWHSRLYCNFRRPSAANAKESPVATMLIDVYMGPSPIDDLRRCGGASKGNASIRHVR
jgi:hypothetical protein